MNQELLGKFIAQERKNKRLTQEQLAEMIGVDRTAVSRWERGLSAPDISLLKQLASALDVSVIELLNCERNNSILNTDDTMIGAMEFYGNKTMKKLRIWLCFIIIILLVIFITAFIVNKRNYFDVNEISYNGDFITSGYYFSNTIDRSIIFVKDFNYNGKYLGTIDEPMTNQLEVSLMANENLILKRILYCDLEYCTLSMLLEDFVIMEEIKDKKYVLDDFSMSIHYKDSNGDEQFFSIPLSDNK